MSRDMSVGVEIVETVALYSPQTRRTGDTHQFQLNCCYEKFRIKTQSSSACPFLGPRDVSPASDVAEEAIRPSHRR